MPLGSLALLAAPKAFDTISGAFGSGSAPRSPYQSALTDFEKQSNSGTGTLLAKTLDDILKSGGKTSPDLFNRLLAGSNRGTASAQANLAATGARSGIDSGIQQALSAAIGLEGADREAGIRAQEAAMTEDRKRSDTSLIVQNLLGPLLQKLSIDSNVSVANNQIAAQQGNQNLQALAALIGGLTSSYK